MIVEPHQLPHKSTGRATRVDTVRLCNHAGEYPVTLDRQEFRLLVAGLATYREQREADGMDTSEASAVLEKCEKVL